MKITVLVLTLFLTFSYTFSQENMDDVFDDGDKETMLKVGNDVWKIKLINWQKSCSFKPKLLLFL